MVFSLFGKKPPPKPQPRRSSSVERTGTSKPHAEKKPEKEAPRQNMPVEPPKPPVVPDYVVEEGLPAVEADSIQIGDAGAAVHPVVEEAAMLFSRGQDEQALGSLEAAVTREEFGAGDEQVWWMLFDLYQVLGRQEPFEAKSLEFAHRFEKSPPSWKGAEGIAGAGAGIAVATLSGKLDATCAKQIEPVQRVLARNPIVRLDVGKVREADAAGCELLLNFIQGARKNKQEVLLHNGAQLAGVLQPMIEIGRRDDQPVWLMLLEVLQQLGQQEPFEDLALNYTVTFEVSPPWWEERPKTKAAASSATGAVSAPGADAFYLRGDLAGANPAAVHALETWAEGREAIVVDLAEARRVDFVFAGMLINALSPALRRGASITLRGASSLVAALLNVVGVNQIATIERRKS
jgi:anti-anti-sigma regulatory factor